jgi:hypothetical protein
MREKNLRKAVEGRVNQKKTSGTKEAWPVKRSRTKRREDREKASHVGRRTLDGCAKVAGLRNLAERDNPTFFETPSRRVQSLTRAHQSSLSCALLYHSQASHTIALPQHVQHPGDCYPVPIVIQ